MADSKPGTSEAVRAGNRRRQREYRARHMLLRRELDAQQNAGVTEFSNDGKFAPGNAQHTTHGARDARRTAELAVAVRDALLANPDIDDHLRNEQFAHAVWAWAWAEAQAQLLRAYVDASGLSEAMTEETRSNETETGIGKGAVDRKAVIRKTASVMDTLHKAEIRAGNFRKELGLTPLARGRLSKDVSQAKAHLIQMWADIDDAPEAIEAPQGGDAAQAS
jgi:hypothetical protein